MIKTFCLKCKHDHQIIIDSERIALTRGFTCHINNYCSYSQYQCACQKFVKTNLEYLEYKYEESIY